MFVSNAGYINVNGTYKRYDDFNNVWGLVCMTETM